MTMFGVKGRAPSLGAGFPLVAAGVVQPDSIQRQQTTYGRIHGTDTQTTLYSIATTSKNIRTPNATDRVTQLRSQPHTAAAQGVEPDQGLMRNVERVQNEDRASPRIHNIVEEFGHVVLEYCVDSCPALVLESGATTKVSRPHPGHPNRTRH
ncbi:hypothetical protein BDV95DRAFT_182529 [Massariosphaeria phaeospora]|uniref:Uncharacterized protein n=1 Tax=Massariosphaeria phaeospora TaxID=100035 RepID=A0A7C8M455_9PLEO|nr:hypothetical protein BDV95DRAFT_182529 [Massariosphaeria phaeospora]